GFAAPGQSFAEAPGLAHPPPAAALAAASALPPPAHPPGCFRPELGGAADRGAQRAVSAEAPAVDAAGVAEGPPFFEPLQGEPDVAIWSGMAVHHCDGVVTNYDRGQWWVLCGPCPREGAYDADVHRWVTWRQHQEAAWGLCHGSGAPAVPPSAQAWWGSGEPRTLAEDENPWAQCQ
ncbi:MAG: hypothetical protein GY772_05000, partial [bacterium]|nr:hypothetical protein [bacterium]